MAALLGISLFSGSTALAAGDCPARLRAAADPADFVLTKEVAERFPATTREGLIQTMLDSIGNRSQRLWTAADPEWQEARKRVAALLTEQEKADGRLFDFDLERALRQVCLNLDEPKTAQAVDWLKQPEFLGYRRLKDAQMAASLATLMGALSPKDTRLQEIVRIADAESAKLAKDPAQRALLKQNRAIETLINPDRLYEFGDLATKGALEQVDAIRVRFKAQLPELIALHKRYEERTAAKAQ